MASDSGGPAGARWPQLISVIIPAHNVATLLGEQLQALCRQRYEGPWDVTGVNNRSTDQTEAVAASYQDRLRLQVISADAGSSPAYARNVGVEASTGELLIFVDADDVADSHLLAAYAARSREWSVMGGRLEDRELNDPVVASWRYAPTPDALPVAFGRFPFFLTANCAIRREVFARIGRFDETLRFVGEDVDFSIRAHLAGFEIGWVPEAVVHYRHRDSIGTLARQQFVYGRGSVHLFMRYGHMTTPQRRVSSWRLLFWLLAGVRHVTGGRRRFGQWLSFAAYLSGQVAESVRQRTWYLG